jgi:hypothetical protein
LLFIELEAVLLRILTAQRPCYLPESGRQRQPVLRPFHLLSVALQELLATTEEPAPLPMNASPVEARYGVAINPHPERFREDR